MESKNSFEMSQKLNYVFLVPLDLNDENYREVTGLQSHTNIIPQ